MCCFLRVEGSVCQAGATSNLLRLSDAPIALVVSCFVTTSMPSFGQNSTEGTSAHKLTYLLASPKPFEQLDNSFKMFPARFLFPVLFSTAVLGNIEKEIFVAPSNSQDLLFNGTNSPQSAEFEALHPGLLRLSPSPSCEGTCHELHVTLNTSFIGSGESHWAVLDHLEQGKRYEVRICWAATVPPPTKLYAST